MKFLIIITLFLAGLLSAEPETLRMLLNAYNIGDDSLGHGLNQVPDGQSGVTSLAIGKDNTVYGATSSTNGKSPFLFQFKPVTGTIPAVQPLDSRIKGQTRISGTLVIGGDGYIYGGSSIYQDTLFVSIKEWVNPKYEGGHLFRFKEGSLTAIEDLGVVLPADGIRVLAIDTVRQKIYGLTEPNYRFFIYDLKLKKTTVRKDVELFNPILADATPRLGELGKALLVASDGKVYGSADKGRLFVYVPESDKLTVTTVQLPSGGEHGSSEAVSAFTTTSDGTIYGGTLIDGVLFRFDPQKGLIQNLGKPLCSPFIRSLAAAKDGAVYGIAGAQDRPAIVFQYKNGSYEQFPFPMVNIIRATYKTYVQDLGPMVYLKNEGMLLMGNQGRIGKLVGFFRN